MLHDFQLALSLEGIKKIGSRLKNTCLKKKESQDKFMIH